MSRSFALKVGFCARTCVRVCLRSAALARGSLLSMSAVGLFMSTRLAYAGAALPVGTPPGLPPGIPLRRDTSSDILPTAAWTMLCVLALALLACMIYVSWRRRGNGLDTSLSARMARLLNLRGASPVNVGAEADHAVRVLSRTRLNPQVSLLVVSWQNHARLLACSTSGTVVVVADASRPFEGDRAGLKEHHASDGRATVAEGPR